MNNSLFIANEAQGGAGGAGGTRAAGGAGGAGQGGGLYNGQSFQATSLSVTSSTITLNQAIGGVGGSAGGTGGAGEGGGLFNSPEVYSAPATLSIGNSAILANAAEGDAGATGGSGGDGLGGGIFNDQGATATVTTSVISANLAQGGLGAAERRQGRPEIAHRVSMRHVFPFSFAIPKARSWDNF